MITHLRLFFLDYNWATLTVAILYICLTFSIFGSSSALAADVVVISYSPNNDLEIDPGEARTSELSVSQITNLLEPLRPQLKVLAVPLADLNSLPEQISGQLQKYDTLRGIILLGHSGSTHFAHNSAGFYDAKQLAEILHRSISSNRHRSDLLVHLWSCESASTRSDGHSIAKDIALIMSQSYRDSTLGLANLQISGQLFLTVRSWSQDRASMVEKLFLRLGVLNILNSLRKMPYSLPLPREYLHVASALALPIVGAVAGAAAYFYNFDAYQHSDSLARIMLPLSGASIAGTVSLATQNAFSKMVRLWKVENGALISAGDTTFRENLFSLKNNSCRRFYTF